MKLIQRMTALALAAGLALPTAAGQWTLSAGLSDGFSLSGTFSGTDLDGDGLVSTTSDEVTAFELLLQGPALPVDVTFELPTLLGLSLRVGGTLLGDGADEGLYVDDGVRAVIAGIGALGTSGVLAAWDGASFEGPTIAVRPAGAAVPLPATPVLLAAAGLAAIASGRRRREPRLPSD